MRQAHFLPSVAVLVSLVSPVLGASASITSVIPGQAHQCISLCAWYNYQGNLPLALGCANPYENDCYCPTASASVSKASAAIDKCVSSRCAAGDLTRDLTSLQSIYAGYCKDAGYSQDPAVLGYTAAEPTSSSSGSASSSTAATGQKTNASQPSKTSAGESVSTTMQKPVISQTTASGADGTSSQGVAQETDGVGGGSSGPSKAVKIGVGVGVPVVVLAILAGAGFLLWRKRKATGHGGGGRVVMEERGGDRAEQGAVSTDRAKGGAVVNGVHEVNGSQSSSFGAHVVRKAKGSERSGSGGRGLHEAGQSRSGSSEVYRAHEVGANQRSAMYEVDSGSDTRLYEVPGQPTVAIELPTRHVGDGHLV